MSNHLTDPYPHTDINEASTTKEKILLEATILFARQGRATVSIRDIARAVNLSQASLYNHFESKEVLWNSVLDHIKSLYLQYFERLDKAVEEAVGFNAVLECMFVEVRQVVHIFTYYGFALIQAEQLSDDKAYEIYSEIFLRYSIGFIAGKFNDCIAKGWARQFDTRLTATFFMHSILNAISMRAHENMGRKIPYDIDELLFSVQQQIQQQGAL